MNNRMSMKESKKIRKVTKLWLSVSWGDSPTTFGWSVEVDLNQPFKFVELSNGRIGFTQIIKSEENESR
jgi:hypothetical protein